MPKHMNRKNLMFLENPTPEGAGGNEPTDPRHPNFKDTTFTQEQVTAFLTREKDQGKRAGVREYAEKFATSLKDAGFDETTPLADILSLAKLKREADDELKSETQKAHDAAAATKSEADGLLAQAKRDRHEAKVERLLSGASNTAVASASLTAYGVTVDSTDDEIKAAITKLKAEAPGLFGSGTRQNTDPGSTRGNQAGTTSPKDRAAAFAKSRGWTE